VELLSGEGQALIVTEHGRSVGIVTRTDLLESLVS
jgi:cystathionine beta-synthase